MACRCRRLSEANSLAIGASQIMIGTFLVLMWYFLLVLYVGQIPGVFGTYEPITYETATFLWGITGTFMTTFINAEKFILSGVLVIGAARYPYQQMMIFAVVINILSIAVSVASLTLVIIELSEFKSVSYRNFAKAKVGREVSRVSLILYPMEFCIASTYSVFNCVSLLGLHKEDSFDER